MSAHQDLLQAVFETVPTAVLILQSLRDRQGQIVDFQVLLANEAANQMATRPVAGLRMLEAWPTTATIGLFDQFVATVNTGELLQTDKHYQAEGVDAWLYWRAARLNDGLCVTIEDITQRRQAQRQIQQTAQHLQRVLDASPATIGLLTAVCDPTNSDHIDDFYLLVGNQKLADFFQEPLTSLLGQPSARFGQMLWGKHTLAKLRRVYRTHTPYYEEKLVGESWLALSILRDGHGLVITGLDITPIKQLQQQQQRFLKDLEEAQRSADALTQLRETLTHRSELLGAISHDLRANLGIVQGGLHLVEAALTEDDRAQMLAMVVRNVGQTTQLLTNLLTVTQLEQGPPIPQLQSLDISRFMSELAQSLQPIAQQKSLILELDGPPSLWVESDPLQLYRLVQNVVLNGLKYTQIGSVRISWRKSTDGAGWWLSIRDTGPGLPPKVLERLQSGRSALVPGDLRNGQDVRVASGYMPWPGEGLGLGIIRQLADVLAVELAVSSEAGQGSEFRLRFPRAYSSDRQEE